MTSKNRHFNLLLIGDLETGINFITLAIAQAASKYGEVLSGNYLDKKTLSSRKELFHIRYYTNQFECEHINCPLYPENIAKGVMQSDAVVMIIDLNKGLTHRHSSILKYAHESGIEQVVILQLVNLASVNEIDKELQELAVLETQETLENIGFTPENVYFINGCIEKDSLDIAANILSIVDMHFRPREYRQDHVEMHIEKVYHVTDKGLRNATVAYGYLKSGIILQGMSLSILGVADQTPIVRIRSMEIFGQEVSRCEAGRSVSVLLEKASKDVLQPGQILTTGEKNNKVIKDFDISILMPILKNIDLQIQLSSTPQIYVFYNMHKINAHFGDIQVETDGKSIKAKILLEEPIVLTDILSVIISTSEILLVGKIKTDS